VVLAVGRAAQKEPVGVEADQKPSEDQLVGVEPYLREEWVGRHIDGSLRVGREKHSTVLEAGPERSPRAERSQLDKVPSRLKRTVAGEGPSEKGAHLVVGISVMEEGTRVLSAHRRNARSERFVALVPVEDRAALVAEVESQEAGHMDSDADGDRSLACCVLHGKPGVDCSHMETGLSADAHATRSYACRVVSARSPHLETLYEAPQSTMKQRRCKDLQKVLLDRSQLHPAVPEELGPFARWVLTHGRVSHIANDPGAVCQALAPSCPKVLLSSVVDLDDAVCPPTP